MAGREGERAGAQISVSGKSARTEAERAPPATRGLLQGTAERLAGLRLWQRMLVAALLGALAAGAFAPTYLVLLLWPAFTGLLWLLGTERKAGPGFAVGWAFGFGHFLLGLHWVGESFMVDAARYGALAPVAVVSLSAGLALFTAAACAVTVMLPARGAQRALALAAAWLVAEWLRSWVLSGFPWHLIGSAWVFSDEMIQLAAYGGVWALTWVTVFAAAAPAVAAEPQRSGALQRWLPAGIGLLLLALVWSGGALRLADAPALGSDSTADITLRLVQPSIAQADKWKPALRQGHVARQIEMSRAPADKPIDLVIWSETAVPYNLWRLPELQRRLGEAVPDGGHLITGAPRQEAGRQGQLWNSLHALRSGGQIVATYDKVKLVPFGEFVPLRSLFGFSKLTQGRVDFSPGPGRRTMTLPGLPPFSPLICYEIIYPGRVLADGERPAWLLSLTNDAWFGRSTGPHQHFAIGKLRAVEEGIPLVRVANTGISAVVDSYGRTAEWLGLEEVGVIDTPLPKALSGTTVFGVVGNHSVLFLLCLTLISWISPRMIGRLYTPMREKPGVE